VRERKGGGGGEKKGRLFPRGGQNPIFPVLGGRGEKKGGGFGKKRDGPRTKKGEGSFAKNTKIFTSAQKKRGGAADKKKKKVTARGKEGRPFWGGAVSKKEKRGRGGPWEKGMLAMGGKGEGHDLNAQVKGRRKNWKVSEGGEKAPL